jgi:hypothetical protein
VFKNPHACYNQYGAACSWQFVCVNIHFLSFFVSFFLSPTSFSLTMVRCTGIIAFDHTQGYTTVGRTPLDEGSARHRYLYLTTHNTQNRQTSMLPAGFEPAIQAGDRPQTLALDRPASTNIYVSKLHPFSSCAPEMLSHCVRVEGISSPKIS